MQSTFQAAFGSTIMLFAYIFAGFLIRKLKVVKEDFSPSLSSLIFNFFTPALLLDVLSSSLTRETLKEHYMLAVMCCVILAACYFFGKLIVKLFKEDENTEKVFLFAMIFSNFGFMGIPVVEALLGKEALLPLTFYSLPIYISVNILGANILSAKSSIINKNPFKNTIVVSILLGIIIGALNIKLPPTVSKFLSTTGNCVTPLSMLLIGFILGNGKIWKMITGVKIYIISFFRLILIPLVIMGVLYLCGLRGLSLNIPVIIASMPLAANCVLLTQLGGGDPFFAAKCTFITTFLSLFTIPLIAMILLR